MSVAGVHKPYISGIDETPVGARSICMSGDYVENIDCGDFFWFCGQGGREYIQIGKGVCTVDILIGYKIL